MEIIEILIDIMTLVQSATIMSCKEFILIEGQWTAKALELTLADVHIFMYPSRKDNLELH